MADRYQLLWYDTRPMRVSILIPVFQEERTITEVLDRVRSVDTKSHGFEKEIIVCDDGSTDDTWPLLQAAQQKIGAIRVVRHEKNRGKGTAIRTALAEATGDYCLVQDADLEYEVSDYPAMLRAARDGADAVYGSRFLENTRPTGMRPANFVANKILTLAANALYGLRITDEATCFKLVRTDLLRSLALSCKGFEFCPEVTAKLGRHKVTIVEVPIAYTARDAKGGKKVRWTDGFEALWVLFKHRFTSK